MTAPVTFARGFTTGTQLYDALEARAAERAQPLRAYVKPLADNPATWLRELARAKRPHPHTIERIRALLTGDPIPPRRSYRREGHIYNAPRPVGPVPEPIDRDPCPMCGTRGDIGCQHQRAAR